MIFKRTYSLLFLMLSFYGYSQGKYTVTFAELREKMHTEPRIIVIKVHTGWCAICRLQDRQIEKDKPLQNLLSEKYYYLEFDAECREPVIFNNVEFRFVPNGTGGLNMLATTLSDGNSSYPLWVFLSPEYKVLSTYNGLLKNTQLNKMLNNDK